MRIKKNIFSVILAACLLSTTACKVDLPFIGKVDLEQVIENNKYWSEEQLKAYSETALSILLNCDESDIEEPYSSTYYNGSDVSGTFRWKIDGWLYHVAISNSGDTVEIKEFGATEPTSLTYNIRITLASGEYHGYDEVFYFDIDRNYEQGTARIGLVGAVISEGTTVKAEYALAEGCKFEYLDYKSKTGTVERFLETNAKPIDPNEQQT